MKRIDRTRSLFARSGLIPTLLATVAAVALTAAAPLQAEAPAGEDDPMHAAKQMHGEYVQLQKRLNKIQAETMKAHPELKEQEQAFLDLMMSKMDTSGATAEADLAEIEGLEQKLRSGDTPESERKELMSTYQEKAMAFRAAQVEALKDPEVQKAQKELMDATMAAMKEQDPQTEEIMEQLKEKQEEMKQMMESAGQSQAK
ncbi:MAG: hypothetical protein PVG38_14580 [Gammaproteobacteria bacterium]|jgi:hypothetical protein